MNRDEIPLKIDKSFTFEDGNRINVRYKLTNLSGSIIEIKFATELNFTLLAGDADDRYYIIPGRSLSDRKLASRGGESDVSVLQMVDEWCNINLSIESEKPCDIWRFPVETVSQSEDGFERNYQNSCIVFVKNLKLAKAVGEELSFTLILNRYQA